MRTSFGKQRLFGWSSLSDRHLGAFGGLRFGFRVRIRFRVRVRVRVGIRHLVFMVKVKVRG